MYTNPSTSPLYQPCLPSLQYHNSPSHFLIYLFYFVNLLRLTRAIFEIRYQLEPDIQLKTWDVQIKTAVIFFSQTLSVVCKFLKIFFIKLDNFHFNLRIFENFCHEFMLLWQIFFLIYWSYYEIFYPVGKVHWLG